MTVAPIVAVRSIAKHFGSTIALAGVDLELYGGEVHALLGENGAGKSTLTRLVVGDQQPTSGEVLIDGEVVELTGPSQALSRGIRLVTQERALVPTLSVAENLSIGRLPVGRFGLVDWDAVRQTATDPLRRIGLDIDPAAEVGRLTSAEQQLVEIAKALVGDARVLILDEPTAALTSAETERLFDVVRSVRAEGIAVLYISHRLDELRQIADRCTILRDGKVAATLPIAEADAGRVAELMVGQPLGEMYARAHPPLGEVVLVADGLACPGLVEAFDLEVRRGEVVALYGLVGSGATEIPYALAGHLAHGGRVERRVPVGLVPADRRGEGLFLETVVRRNLTAPSLTSHSVGPFHRRAREVRSARAVVALLRVKPSDPEAAITTLSGGNQQKAMVGRWFEAGVGALLMSEPTRGVDVGARRDIYGLIGAACERGMAVVFASSDIDEVVGLADRAVLIRDGRTVGECSGEDLNASRLLELVAQ